MENKERTTIIDLHKLRTCEMVRIYSECKKDCKTCDFYVKPERKKKYWKKQSTLWTNTIN